MPMFVFYVGIVTIRPAGNNNHKTELALHLFCILLPTSLEQYCVVVFSAWAHYYREKKRLILEEQAKLEAACSRYKEHLLCKTFDHWLMWMRDISARKECKQ